MNTNRDEKVLKPGRTGRRKSGFERLSEEQRSAVIREIEDARRDPLQDPRTERTGVDSWENVPWTDGGYWDSDQASGDLTRLTIGSMVRWGAPLAVPGAGLAGVSAAAGTGAMAADLIDGKSVPSSVASGVGTGAITYVGGKVLEKLFSMSANGIRSFLESWKATDKAVSDAQVNLLKEMIKYKRAHSGNMPAEVKAEFADKMKQFTGPGKVPQLTGPGKVPQLEGPQEHFLLTWNRMLSGETEDGVAAGAASSAVPAPSGKIQGVDLDALIKANDPDVIQWGKNVDRLLKWVPPKPAFTGSLRNGTMPKFDQAKLTAYLSDVRAKFGDNAARNLESMLVGDRSGRFARAMYPDGYAEKAAKYAKMRELHDLVSEPGEVVLSGSPGIASEGTLFRDVAAPHDLDFAANVFGASRKPVAMLTEAEQTARLSDVAAIENSPVFAKLREKVPELKNARFRHAKRDYEFDYGPDGYSTEYRYSPDFFTIPMVKPSASADGRMTRLVTVRINGEPVDIFLQDAALGISENSQVLGSADAAMQAKLAYRSHGKPRPKDAPDISGFKKYSDDNLMIDLMSGQSQFSSFQFPEKAYLTEDGFPVVAEMQIRPGLDVKTPVVMNDRGQFIQLNNPDPVLNWYNPGSGIPGTPTKVEHPMYWFAGSPEATADTHPLVAISGSSGQSAYGIESPSIALYSARDLDTLVNDIPATGRSGNWATYPIAGKYKDILIFPRAGVDPRYNPRTALWDRDAYTNVVIPNTDPMASLTAVKDSAENWGLKSAGKDVAPYGSGIPYNYPEINSAYRRNIYRNNPSSHFSGAPELSLYRGYGESKAAMLHSKDDYVKIPGSLLENDPDKAKAVLRAVLERMKFAAPVTTGAGAAGYGLSQDAEVRQDAKGGETETEAQTVARINEGITEHPGFTEDDYEDMRRSAAYIADPNNGIKGLLVEGTLKHDAERPTFYSRNGLSEGQTFTGDRYSAVETLRDGRNVVIPTIYQDEDGVTRLHTRNDAWDHYLTTDEHFGIYDTVQNAVNASIWSHHAGNAGWLKTHAKDMGVRQDAKGGETADQVYERHAAAMDAVVPFIKAHEGFRSEAYLDPVGKWTIGYGQTEIGGRPVMRGDTIDEETASEFVRQRVRRNADAIYRNMEWTRNASSGALAALYDLAYNGGVGMIGPDRSPTLNRMGAEAVTRDAVDEAVWSQLPTYVSAGGRRMRGLVRRRSDAISQFRHGS